MASPEELARALRDAIVRGDEAAVTAMSTPGATVWHNTDGVAAPTPPDGPAQLHAAVRDVTLDVDRLTPLPGGFVLQFTLRGTARATGAPFVSRACLVVDVEDGKLARTSEYVDSAAYSPLVG